MTAIHRFPFKTKIKHLRRRRFVQAQHSFMDTAPFAITRCRCCGKAGLTFYRFKTPPTVFVNAFVLPVKTRYREFLLCMGCGCWRELDQHVEGREHARRAV